MILLIEAIKQVADGLSLEFCGVRLKKKKQTLTLAALEIEQKRPT